MRANLDLGYFCQEVDNAAPLDRKVAQEPGGTCIGPEFQGVHLNFPTNSLRKRLRRAVRDAERAGVGLDCHGVNLGDSDQWFAQEAPSNCFEVLASPRSGCTDGMEGEYLANQDPMVRGEFAGYSVADEPTTHGGDGPGLGGLDGWVTVGSGLSEEKGYGHPREDVDRNGKGSGSAPRAAKDPEATGSERQEGRGEESQPPVSITTNKTTILAPTNARETSGPSSHEGRGSNWDPGGAPRYQHRPPVFITAGEPTLLAPTSARTASGPLPLEGRGCTWDPGGAPHHQNQNITVSETRRDRIYSRFRLTAVHPGDCSNGKRTEQSPGDPGQPTWPAVTDTEFPAFTGNRAPPGAGRHCSCRGNRPDETRAKCGRGESWSPKGPCTSRGLRQGEDSDWSMLPNASAGRSRTGTL